MLTHSHSRAAPLAGCVALTIACLAVTACGSSTTTGTSAVASSTASASESSSATGAAPDAGSAGNPAAGTRGASLRTCLEKQGITLPQGAGGPAGAGGGPPAGASGAGGPPAGGGPPTGGGGPGGGAGLPAGVNASQFQAALKKCGGGTGFARSSQSSAADRAALTKYASCMRSNGVKLPAPNVSGTGPVFDTTGLDTKSAAFKAASATCASDLRGTAFGRGAGAASSTGGSTSPPGT